MGSPSHGKHSLRGDLWWVALDPTVGSEISKTRPCLVLSTNAVNEHRRTVVVIPLSSSPSAYPPITVTVECEGVSSVAVVDQVRAISRHRLRKRIGALKAQELAAVESALRQVLELGF